MPLSQWHSLQMASRRPSRSSWGSLASRNHTLRHRVRGRLSQQPTAQPGSREFSRPHRSRPPRVVRPHKEAVPHPLAGNESSVQQTSVYVNARLSPPGHTASNDHSIRSHLQARGRRRLQYDHRRRQEPRGSLVRPPASPASIAQGIEHRFPKPCVAGSNPARGTTLTCRSTHICRG